MTYFHALKALTEEVMDIVPLIIKDWRKRFTGYSLISKMFSQGVDLDVAIETFLNLPEQKSNEASHHMEFGKEGVHVVYNKILKEPKLQGLKNFFILKIKTVPGRGGNPDFSVLVPAAADKELWGKLKVTKGSKADCIGS